MMIGCVMSAAVFGYKILKYFIYGGRSVSSDYKEITIIFKKGGHSEL